MRPRACGGHVLCAEDARWVEWAGEGGRNACAVIMLCLCFENENENENGMLFEHFLSHA